MEVKGRVEWVDLCKMLTMLIVCYDHTIQSINPDAALKDSFFVGTISFHMPLFMLLSGFFIKLDKIRQIPLWEFCISKFKHLMIPAFSWYAIQCLLFVEKPEIKNAFESYWFLSCLFFCYCIVAFTAKKISNNWTVFILISVITYFLPYAYFVKINFLIPFLGIGYLINRRVSYLKWKYILPVFVIYLIFFQYWTFEDSVYITPIRFNGIDSVLQISYIAFFRFIVAVLGSLSVIYACLCLTKYFPGNAIVRFLIKYGKYTLSIYTIHFIFIKMLKNVFGSCNMDVNQYPLVLISILISITIVVVSLFISYLLRYNHYMRKILLGEF